MRDPMRRFTIIILLIIISHSASSASQALDIGPIADIDDLSVGTMRGDSLGLPSDRGTPVFGTDFTRVDRLEAQVKDIASERFKAGGLRVHDDSKNAVMFELFGGTFAGAKDDSLVFFMLQVSVCLEGQSSCSKERTLLGVVKDPKVEESVLSAVLEVTNDFIQARSRYRALKQ